MDCARKLNLDVYPWTVNDPAQMQEMLDLGAAGIVTDFPEALDQVIDRHIVKAPKPTPLG
jgi:glycerophosphoryl diester phosphodiesterase